jgi:radical SAM superfamily enzyme YgiQ (UPF0313 family)
MHVIFWNGGIPDALIQRSIGPYKVAHWIRKHGFNTQVIDFVDRMKEDTLVSITKKFISHETLVLAISTTFLCERLHLFSNGSNELINESVLNALRQIKAEFPKIKIILGGYKSEKLSGWGVVDATIMSYTESSEDIFLEYLNSLKYNSEPPRSQIIFPSFDKKRKHRLWFFEARKKVYSIELDDFKFTNQDCILENEPLPLDISRGCIFSCKFCQYPHLGKKKFDYVRHFSLIKEEIEYNYKNFKTKNYYILDDTFNDTEFKLKEFYKITEQLDFKINFVSYLRADLLDRFKDTPYLLKESGLISAFHGIETFNQESSKIIGKAWSGKHAKTFIPELTHNIWKDEVLVHCHFIVGLPFDTPDDILKTADWAVSENIHHVYFDPLGLYGVDNKSSKWSIESEFDKNSELYGFKFIDDGEQSNRRSWVNNNWSSLSSLDFSRKINQDYRNSFTAGPWEVPALLWQNFSKKDILKKKKNDYDWNSINQTSKQFIHAYIQKLNLIK